MPNVDFYLLNESAETMRERFACRLAGKAYQQQQKAYIYCDNLEVAKRLDDLLWTFQAISFIPHSLVTEPDYQHLPIWIGYEELELPTYELLINLSTHMPTFLKDFKRVIEIVGCEDSDKALAREKYKAFQKMGCLLKVWDLKAR
jgi:DNA polymerase III subunit chi